MNVRTTADPLNDSRSRFLPFSSRNVVFGTGWPSFRSDAPAFAPGAFSSGAFSSGAWPTFCPLMDRNFATLQGKLEEDRGLNVHLLTVSFDPETDTPAVLKAHAKELGANPKIWTFLTGDLDTIDQFAGRFGVSIQRVLDEQKQVNITHNLRTAILDREGNLVKSYTGNEWTPAQVLADVKVLVGVD